jgi:hypothetical protein
MIKSRKNRRQWSWLAFILMFGLSLTLGAMVALARPAVAAPPPQQTGQPAAYAGSQACANCHKELHADWMTTRHSQAFSSPIFQRDWTELPADFLLTMPHHRFQSSRRHIPEEGVTCESLPWTVPAEPPG